MALPLALHSIPVEDIPVEVGILVEEDSFAMTGMLVAVGIPAAAGIAVEDSLAVEDNLAVAHNPGVDILEVAFAAQPCQIVVARVDQDWPHAFQLLVVQVLVFQHVALQAKVFLPLVVRVVVLLLVVRLAVPGCSYVSPSRVPYSPYE